MENEVILSDPKRLVVNYPVKKLLMISFGSLAERVELCVFGEEVSYESR